MESVLQFIGAITDKTTRVVQRKGNLSKEGTAFGIGLESYTMFMRVRNMDRVKYLTYERSNILIWLGYVGEESEQCPR